MHDDAHNTAEFLTFGMRLRERITGKSSEYSLFTNGEAPYKAAVPLEHAGIQQFVYHRFQRPLDGIKPSDSRTARNRIHDVRDIR